MSWIRFKVKFNFITECISIFFLTIFILVFLEVCARIFIWAYTGNSTAGIQERTQFLKYQPFTMWGKDLPEQAQKYLYEHQLDDIKILILGASTAEGFANYHDILIDEIRKEEKFNKSKISIFNAASGGFNIRQEAISLMLVAEKIKPNIIFVIDGANDIQNSMRMGSDPEKTYVDSSFNIILSNPLLAPLVYLIQNSQLYNGFLRFYARLPIDQSYDKSVRNAERIYLDTREFISAYAKGKNIQIVFMLQPHVAFSNVSEDSVAKSQYKFREKIVVESFNNIDSKSQNLCFVNANEALNLKSLKLEFSDDVHFKNSIGYYFMSELIANKFNSCYTFNSSRTWN
jgi:hypothetical protein